MKNNKALKIIVPLIMIFVIAGIWFFQSRTDEDEKGADNSQFPLTITSVNIEELKKSGLPIIIDFGADECIPCKQMYPVLVDMNKEMQGKAIIQFIDVWKNPIAVTNFPVQLIPTQLFYNADGTPYIPSDEIASTIEFTTYSHRETEEHIFTTHQGGLTEEQMKLILKDMGVE